MDRIDAMTIFTAVVDEGSLAAAARRLRRSPANVTRAIAFLEARLGTRLLHRTTRAIRLSEAGERYLATCRRVLAELAEADSVAAGEREALRGMLTVTAPAFFGRLHVRPVVDEFLDAHRHVQVRLLLLDRVVDLIDEGVDIAIRIGRLPDSSLIAVKAGEVRRVTCASPNYLVRRSRPERPADLATHDCISFSETAVGNVWGFDAGPGGGRAQQIRVRPRLTVNSAEAAVASAVRGGGVTSVLSYQAERELAEGSLVPLLEPFAPPPLPISVVYPAARFSVPKARAFIDLIVPRLKAR
jgi:DNA-binding transcriptional LysR family regulator